MRCSSVLLTALKAYHRYNLVGVFLIITIVQTPKPYSNIIALSILCLSLLSKASGLEGCGAREFSCEVDASEFRGQTRREQAQSVGPSVGA